MSQQAEYNPDNHFVRRAQGNLESPSVSPMSQLEAAAQKHKQRVAAREQERVEQVETYRNTLVGQGGFGQDSILGQYFNTGFHQADKAVQGGGWLANAPIETYEGMMRSGLDEGAHEAYARVKEDEARFKQLGQLKGKRISDQLSTGERVEMNALGAVPNTAREGDQELLAQQPESSSSEKTAEIFPDMAPLPNPMASKENPDGERDALTNRERLERADGAAKASDLIREAADNSHLVDQTDMNDFVQQLAAGEDGSMEQLREGWASIKDGETKEGLLDSADAVGNMVANAWGASGDNKLGFFQTISGEITEDLAPLAAGGATGQALNVAQNASYALDSLNSGRENFIAKHGREPDGEEMGDMMTKAMLAFGVNQVGDVGLTKAIQGAGKAVPRANGAAGTVQNVAGAAGRTGAQTGGQAVLEGVETYASGEAAYDPASGEDIVVAASIGGGMGAAASAPDVAGAAIGATADAGRGVVNKATKGIQEDAANQAERVKAGSPGNLANVDSEEYNPREAMEVIARADGRPEVADDQKRRNREMAEHIVTNTRADLRQLDLDIKNATPEEKQNNQSLLTELKAEKDALASGEGSKMLDAQIGMLEENIERAENVTPTQIKEMKTRANQLRRDLPKINAQYEGVTGKTKITPEEMDTLIGKANGEVAPETTEGTQQEEGDTEVAAEGVEESNEETTQRVFSMIARDPMGYSSDQLDSLASGDNGLTDGQRNTLRRLSKAKVDENLVKGADEVSDNVLNGADGYKGTRTYLENVAKAKQNVNPKKVEKEMKGLREFATSRRSKLEAAQQAQAQAKTTGEPVQIVRDNQDGWKINDGKALTKVERDQNGAGQLEGDTKGDNYVNSIATDTQVVESALSAAEAMTRPDADITPMQEKQIAEQRRVRAEQANARVQEAASNVAEPEVATTENAEPVADVESTVTPEQETADAESGATATDGNAAERTSTEVEAAPDTTVTEPNTAVPADNTAETTTESEPESVTESEPTTEAETETESGQEPDSEPESSQETEPEAESGQAKVDNDGGIAPLDNDTAILQESSNPTQRWVRQAKNNGEKSKQRPLRGVRNFVTAATNDNSLVMRFLNDREFSGEQVDAVDTYMSAMRSWVTLANESLSKRNLGTIYPNDLAEGLANEDGTYDENLATAIASAGYLWVAEQGTSTQFNEDSAINKILSRPTGKTVSNATRQTLAPAGDFRNLVINNLGKRAVDALGLRVDPNAPSDVRSRLESSLGAHAYNVLVQQGIIKETVISASAMNTMKGEGKPEEFRGKRQPDAVFARLTGSTQMEERSSEATAIADSTKGSQNILNELLGVEASKKVPSFKPLVFAQKLAQKSMRAVSKVQSKALKKHSQKAYVARSNDMGKVADVLRRHEGAMQAMAGYVDMESTYVHPDNEMGVKGKNDGIEREVEDYFTMMDILDGEEGGRETKFYLGHNVWINQRTGMENSLINLQNSKIHRHLVQMEGWQDTDVSMDEADPRFVQFQLAVADALKIKTDGMSREKAIAKMEAKMAEPVMQNGLVTLQKMINDIEPSDQDIENLQAAVAAGKENFHSLDGLMAYAQYDLAYQAGESTFTHGLTREIDGKTNGPMLTQILTGAAKGVDALNDMVQKGGFFTEASGFTNVNEWAEEGGNYDLYESVAEAVGGTVRNSIESTGDPRYNALFNITNPLLDSEGNVTSEGRGATKTPVTEITFGSAVKNTIQSMAEGFSNELTAKVEDIVRENNANGTNPDAELLVLSKSVKTLTGMRLTPNQLMNEIPNRVTESLESAYTELMGDAIEAGINSHYESFLDIRDEVTESSRTAFDLYDILYEQEAEEMRKGVNKNKANKDIHDLTREQYAEIDQRLKAAEPIAHTVMSKMDKNLEAGFSLYKDRNQLSSESTYQSEVHFGESGVHQPYLDTNTGQQRVGRKKTTLVSGMQRKRTDRGVGVMVMLVHSLDSAIAVMSFRDRTALNVHDALIVSASKAVNQAKLLNSNTFKVLLDYSPNREVADAFGRTVSGFLSQMENGKNTAITRDQYAALNGALHKEMALEEEAAASALGLDAVGYKLLKMKRTAKTSDITKLEAMQQWQNVDQYSLEEGQYELDADDHAAITERLNARKLDNPQAELDDAKRLGELMGTTIRISGEARTQTNETRNQYGKFAKTANPHHNMGLADDMEAAHKGMTVGTLMPILKKHIAKVSDPKQRRFYAKLYQSLNKVLDKNATVDYLVRDAALNEGKTTQMNEKDAAHYDSGNNAYAFKSPDYAHSEVSIESVTHELLHGAVHDLIEKRKTKRNDPLITELEALRTQAEAIYEASDDGSMTDRDKYGTRNIHELLSVGMTNFEFQDKVLKKVRMRSTLKYRVIDGVEKLAETLVKAITGKDTSVSFRSDMQDGLSVLIGNAAELLAEARNRDSEDTAEDNGIVGMEGPADPFEAVERWNSYEVFEAVEGTDQANSASHKDNMRRLLDGIVTKLHGPAGVFMEQAKKSRASSPEDVLQKANEEGVAPFSSQTTTVGFDLTPQESLVLEQVEATVAASLDSSNTAYKELAKVFQAARKQLGYADFHDGDYTQATPTEKAQAKKLYDHVFKMESDAAGKSGHLSRFAALALAHEPLREKLNKVDTRGEVVPENASLATKIQTLFNQMLNWINQKMTKTANIHEADRKVETLVSGLVHIESKRRRSLATERYNPLEFMEGSLRNVSNKVSGTIASALDSKFLRENRYGVVRGTSAAASHVVDGSWKEYLQELQDFRSYMLEKRQGLVSGLVTEMMGEGDGSNVLYRLHRVTKTNEMLRDSHIRNTTNRILDNFDKAGKKLTKEEKAGLTYALLRTDAGSLLDHHSAEEVQALLLNDAHRKQMQRQLEAQLKELPEGNKYVMQAQDLAHFMATGVTDNPMLQLNAHGIANLHGLEEGSNVSPTQETVDLINQYTTLAAMGEMPSKHMAEAKRVIEAESQRGEASGVAYALRVANDQRKEAEQRLFSSNPTQMVKGYVKEITDPNVSIVAATAKEGEELAKMGYQASPDLLQDASDRTETRRLYVLEDGGSKQYLSGAMSLSSQQVKGTTLSSKSTTTRSRTEETARVTHEKRKRLKAMQAKGTKRSRSVRNQTMVPVFNPEGQVVDYRYMMSHEMRDSVLRRNNSIEDVMGSLSGQLVDRQTGPEHNHEVVQALKDVHTADYAKRPSAYLTVGPRSEDPKLREAYRMLPVETRQDIKEIWGDEGMQVRDDVVNLMFGYRKYSLGDMMKKADYQRNTGERAATWFFKGLLGDKAGARIHRFEDVLKTISGEIKDNLVVKNLKTLSGNVSSNATQLVWHGVDPKAIAGDHKKAVEGAITYRRDNTELQEAQERKGTGYTKMRDGTNLDQRISELKDSLARNPSTRLIESGMLPTIVEDIDMINDPFSYQSKTLDRVDKYVSKTPKAIRAVGKQVYMTHDTASYKVLSQATQLSDYAARYTLYQHVTTRKQNPLSHEDAMDLVMDAFVNYDIPTPKAIQYLNDVGVLRFTKYYLRIQRVIMSLFRDKPMRGLAILAAGNYLGNVQTLMDSSMANNMGNPIDGSVLDYGDSVGGIATVDALTGFFQ